MLLIHKSTHKRARAHTHTNTHKHTQTHTNTYIHRQTDRQTETRISWFPQADEYNRHLLRYTTHLSICGGIEHCIFRLMYEKLYSYLDLWR